MPNSSSITLLIAQADDAYYAAEYDKAIELYREALKLEPSNERAQTQIKKAELANEEDKRKANLPREAMQLYRMARSFITAGDAREAAKILVTAIDIARKAYVSFPEAQTLLDSIDKQLVAERHRKMSVLFIAADPTDATRLRLGEEAREIKEKLLQIAKRREDFELHQQWSARPEDISQALLDTQPQIVHFSGHGFSGGALCFENQAGQTLPVEAGALAALFSPGICANWGRRL